MDKLFIVENGHLYKDLAQISARDIVFGWISSDDLLNANGFFIADLEDFLTLERSRYVIQDYKSKLTCNVWTSSGKLNCNKQLYILHRVFLHHRDSFRFRILRG